LKLALQASEESPYFIQKPLGSSYDEYMRDADEAELHLMHLALGAIPLPDGQRPSVQDTSNSEDQKMRKRAGKRKTAGKLRRLELEILERSGHFDD
jgi:hypothetical protein